MMSLSVALVDEGRQQVSFRCFPPPRKPTTSLSWWFLRRRPNGESQSTAPPNQKIDRSRGMMKGLRDDEETRH
ncbi:hypothetical protein F2Q69_00050579 [Brassica cretica]|uniref:Uncharacterized protein n=1 Tax=Brassica cretica TaxID=69181 RepID=A0A8S9Q1H5_BRACR|nr:hypothetical protein F2Q69_00050579 [Brassica cretica]